MPSLQEMYEIVVELDGADSPFAKNIKEQVEGAKARKTTIERHFSTGTVGPSFQALGK